MKKDWMYIGMFIDGRDNIKRAKKFGFKTQKGTRATGQLVFAFMKTYKKYEKLIGFIREEGIKYRSLKTLTNANGLHQLFVRECWI